jgi:predicted molibdopterin-dependent oxidoreductase YjgC
MAMWGEPTIHVHPRDAETLGIGKGDLVRIGSANGSVEMRARVHDDVQPGQVFLPIHHQDQPVNRLVPFQANGNGRRPSIKSLAVSLERIGGPAPKIERLARKVFGESEIPIMPAKGPVVSRP